MNETEKSNLKIEVWLEYKVLTHWENFRKYPPREGRIYIEPFVEGTSVLEAIYEREQNEITPNDDVPSAGVGDWIIFEDGRMWEILDEGFKFLGNPKPSMEAHKNIRFSKSK